jgi:NAD(P)H-hydrate epimerase
MLFVTKSIIREVYKTRKQQSHKYDFGALLIIGGSRKYSGSPGFNALAALAMSAYRSGVDIVEVAAPERAANIIAAFSPDIIAYPLKGDFIAKKHIKTLLGMTRNKTAVVIGGGIERKRETLFAVKEFLKKINLPCVIDADAIYSLAKNKQILKKNFIITPHAYEFYVLTRKKILNLSLKQKIKVVKDSASNLNCVILLKGNPDVISDGSKVAINKTGNAFMTVGGTGDVLAGILGSLLAQGMEGFKAACAAAYINGKAGDIAAKKKKQSLIATDLLNEIPKVVA